MTGDEGECWDCCGDFGCCCATAGVGPGECALLCIPPSLAAVCQRRRRSSALTFGGLVIWGAAGLLPPLPQSCCCGEKDGGGDADAMFWCGDWERVWISSTNDSEFDFLARRAIRTAAMNSWCFARQLTPLFAASPPLLPPAICASSVRPLELRLWGNSRLDSRKGHLPLTGCITLWACCGGLCDLPRSHSRGAGAKSATAAS